MSVANQEIGWGREEILLRGISKTLERLIQVTSAYGGGGGGGGGVWGSITGLLSNQTDLQNALNAKQNTITLTTTGTSGAATLVGSTLNIPQYPGNLGTVTSFSFTNGAGINGIISNATTTPALSLTLGAITPTSVNGIIVGGSSSPSLSVIGTTVISNTNTGDQTTSGTTSRITVANGSSNPVIDISATFEALLGKVANPLSQFASTTSAQLRTVISDETGTGSLVFSSSPVFTTPNIGNAIGSISGNAATATALETPRTIGIITGDATSSGSSFDGTANNTNAITLATVNSNVGSFGSSTQSPSLTVDAKGRITSVSNVTISGTTPGGAAGGDLSGTYPNPTVNNAALTKTDDTNVTLTLGGTPTNALLAATSLTLGWTGQLSLSRGGSNASLTASNGGIIYSTASAMAVLGGTATAGQIIRSGSLSAPTWSTATYPATAGTSGNVLASDGTNFVSTTPPYYLLASGGTASAANTFTFNTAGWHTISNTFTTTANNQWGNRFTGTQTLRNTASDVYSQVLIDPTIVHAANTQVTAALQLSPTFTVGAFTNPVTSAIYIQDNGATSNLNIPFYYNNTNDVRFKFQLRNDGSIRMGNSSNINGLRASGTNFGQLILTTDFATSSSTDVPSLQFTSSANASTTGNRILIGTVGGSIFAGSGSSTFTYFSIKPQLSPSGIVPLIGIDYDPDISSSTSSGAHYSALFRKGSVGILTGAPNSSLQVAGSLSLEYVAKSANYTLTATDQYVDYTSSTSTATLPTAVGIAGRLYTIKNSGTGIITIATTSSQTIDGASTWTLNPGDWLEVQSNNANWTVMSSGFTGTNEINSNINTYTNYTTTATYQNITSITLTPGEWDISAFATVFANGATVTAASDAIFVISTTTASAAGASEGKNIAYIPNAALLGTSHASCGITPYRVSPTTNTTYFFNTQNSFTVGSPQFVGSIRASRIKTK